MKNKKYIDVLSKKSYKIIIDRIWDMPSLNIGNHHSLKIADDIITQGSVKNE